MLSPSANGGYNDNKGRSIYSIEISVSPSTELQPRTEHKQTSRFLVSLLLHSSLINVDRTKGRGGNFGVHDRA